MDYESDADPLSQFQINHEQVVNKLLPDLHKHIYQHQKDALVKIKEYFQQDVQRKIAIVVLPTGSGKSGIASLAPYVLNSRRVLIITPSIVITKQLFEDFCGPQGETFYEKREIIKKKDRLKFIETGLMVEKTDQIRNMEMNNLVIANAQKFASNSNVDIDNIPADLFDLVIVDEAHHYPARTWKRIIDYFQMSKKLFLTATPKHGGGDIIDNQREYICYQLTREDLVTKGIIRQLLFEDAGVNSDNEERRVSAIGERIYQLLQEHDRNHPNTEHQAMIITQTKADCDKFVNIINNFFIATEIAGHRNIAESYYGTDKKNVLDRFKAGEIRILLVCGKLIEGFDRKQVSVVGILRKIQPKSKAFFAQFVGRCMRRVDRDDNITAYVISHPYYNQKTNFESMDEIAEFDPEDLDN